MKWQDCTALWVNGEDCICFAMAKWVWRMRAITKKKGGE